MMDSAGRMLDTAGAVEQMGAKHVNKDVHISFEILKSAYLIPFFMKQWKYS